MKTIALSLLLACSCFAAVEPFQRNPATTNTASGFTNVIGGMAALSANQASGNAFYLFGGIASPSIVFQPQSGNAVILSLDGNGYVSSSVPFTSIKIVSDKFIGNGATITNIWGPNIQAGTVTTNQLDTGVLALIGSLGMTNYIVNLTAEGPVRLVSGTNTAQLWLTSTGVGISNVTMYADSFYDTSGQVGIRDIPHGPLGPTVVKDVIFYSDFGWDWAKVHTLKALLNAHVLGHVNVLGLVAQGTNWWDAAALEAELRYYGLANTIPVARGSLTTTYSPLNDFAEFMATNSFTLADTNRVYVDGITLSRKLLASRPAHSVWLFNEGQFPTLADLWNSAGDTNSTLTGSQLMEEKVAKIIIIAGNFPYGREGNLAYAPTSAQAIRSWTNIPVAFSDGTGGDTIGGILNPINWFGGDAGPGVTIASNFWAKLDPADPAGVAALYMQQKHDQPADTVYPFRPAWAPMGILYLIHGTNDIGIDWFKEEWGYNHIGADGTNWWDLTEQTPGGWSHIGSSYGLPNGLTTNDYVLALNSLMYLTNNPGAPSNKRWTPHDSTPSAWIETTRFYHYTNAEHIRILHDLSGKEGQINLLRTGTYAPTNVNNVINGRPAMMWDHTKKTSIGSASIDSSVAPFSMAGVIYVTNAAVNNPICSGLSGNLNLRVYQNRLQIQRQNTPPVVGSSAEGSIQNDVWYAYVVTYGADGSFAFYTNGVPCGSGQSLVTFGTPAGTLIGSDDYDSFGGFMTSWIKWDRELKPQEVAQVFDYYSSPDVYYVPCWKGLKAQESTSTSTNIDIVDLSTAGSIMSRSGLMLGAWDPRALYPVGWWNASSVSGTFTVWPDSSSSGNDLTDISTLGVTCETNILNGYPAVRFDASITNTFAAPAIISSNLPVTLWAIVYPTNVTSHTNTIFGSLQHGLSLDIVSGKLRITKTYDEQIAASSGSLVASNWYAVIATYDENGGYRFWINGVLDSSGTNAVAITATTGTYLGVTMGGYHEFGGYIADAGRLNHFLTSAESDYFRYYFGKWLPALRTGTVYSGRFVGDGTSLTNSVRFGNDVTATPLDYFLGVAGDHSCTLPGATTNAGKEFLIKCVSAGTNAILPVSAQTVDGYTLITNVSVGKFTRIISDGTNWWITGQN